MSKHKYIYWRPDMPKNDKGLSYANVHLLIGYNQASIADFLKMVAEIRETFPQATDEEIQAGTISQSRSVNGFTIVAWGGYLPEGEYPGWDRVPHERVEYCW